MLLGNWSMTFASNKKYNLSASWNRFCSLYERVAHLALFFPIFLFSYRIHQQSWHWFLLSLYTFCFIKNNNYYSMRNGRKQLHTNRAYETKDSQTKLNNDRKKPMKSYSHKMCSTFHNNHICTIIFYKQQKLRHIFAFRCFGLISIACEYIAHIWWTRLFDFFCRFLYAPAFQIKICCFPFCAVFHHIKFFHSYWCHINFFFEEWMKWALLAAASSAWRHNKNPYWMTERMSGELSSGEHSSVYGMEGQ